MNGIIKIMCVHKYFVNVNYTSVYSLRVTNENYNMVHEVYLSGLMQYLNIVMILVMNKRTVGNFSPMNDMTLKY